MKKELQKGFIIQGILALVVLILIAIGAYYLNMKKSTSIPMSQSTTSEIQWKTYKDNTYGFSFDYPSDYEDFKNGTAISNVVVNDNTYPVINVRTSPLDTYEFIDRSGGDRMTYNSATKECSWGYEVSDTKNPSKEKYYVAGHPACKVSTGDAGTGVFGYGIPDEKNNRMIQILFMTEDGRHRELDTDYIMNSFKFISATSTNE